MAEEQFMRGTYKMVKLGTPEMADLVSADYFKPQKGQVYTVKVLSDDVEEYVTEFQKDGMKQQRVKYKLLFKVGDNNKEITWGVSKRVLGLINEYYKETKEFTVILGEHNYNIVPNGIKNKK